MRSWMWGVTTNTGEWKEWACYSWKQHLESYPAARENIQKAASFVGYVRSQVVNSEIIISSSEMIQTFVCLHTKVCGFPFWAENVEWSSSYNSMSHSPRVTVGVGPFHRKLGYLDLESWLFHLITAIRQDGLSVWFPPWQNGIIWPTSKGYKMNSQGSPIWWYRTGSSIMLARFYWVFCDILWKHGVHILSGHSFHNEWWPAPPCLLTFVVSVMLMFLIILPVEHSSSHVPQKLCKMDTSTYDQNGSWEQMGLLSKSFSTVPILAQPGD